MSDDLEALTRTPDLDRQVPSDDSPESSPAGDARDRGMLDWKPGKLARHLVKMWKSLNTPMQYRITRWKVNKARRGGAKFVGLVKDQDTNTWRMYTPPGTQRVPPSQSRAPRLCRRTTAQMFQDPPTPECIPARDDDEARDAAELSTRLLINMSSEAGTNSLRSARRAFDKIHTHGSGFRYHVVERQGGGAAPETILASLEAAHEDEAIERTETVVGFDGMPVERVVRLPEPYVPRYVREDGTLTDRAIEAREVWLPRIRHEVHTGQTVRLFPVTCNDVSQASEALIMSFRRWGDVRAEFAEELDRLDEEARKAIVAWRPEHVKDLLPDHLREQDLEGTEKSNGQLSDDAICILLIAYGKAGPSHSDGLYAVVAGGKHVLAQEEWRYVNEETGKVEPLDIPLDQFKGWDEGDDDPYGWGMMDRLGDGDELLAQIDGSRILHFNRLGARKTFLPMSSSLTSRSLQAATGTVIPYSGGKPEFEDIPNYPNDTIAFRDSVAAEMTDESGLQPAAQGQDTPNIQSGFHAVQMIEQSLAGMSDLRQNAADALVRGWRIDLQLTRAFFTGVHLLQQVGVDGAIKLEHWTAADLADTSDVQLLRGTFSMMSPSMRSSIALAMNQAGLISREGLLRATSGGTGGITALQDDPHILRVRRQLAAWEDGPTTLPDGAPDPMAVSPFDYRPVDDQPDVAVLRLVELGRAMASSKYLRKPTWWQAGLVDAYQRAQMAAAGTPLPPPAAPDPSLPPGATTGATPATPPIVGQPANAIGARQPDAGIAGLGQPAPVQSPVTDAGDPQLSGVPLPAAASTLPV